MSVSINFKTIADDKSTNDKVELLMAMPRIREFRRANANYIYDLISQRSERVCCFIPLQNSITTWKREVQVVYRIFATLRFIFIVDVR